MSKTRGSGIATNTSILFCKMTDKLSTIHPVFLMVEKEERNLVREKEGGVYTLL